ncbi:MAG: 16S rRNA (guanine(527)-N(7))-methyltransferase RsmG, partial [Acidobacteriales bacterium]|nr:16S rRNA (guanine(527)-N(7))-methyltransferase RsmG [Terriglobales bacterium]
MLRYLELLVKWNARMNLTVVGDERQIVQRHFGESLAVAEWILREVGSEGRLFDLGAGAGFPGAPIAVRCPGWQVTLIESQKKKATFLREMVRVVELSNCSVFAGRAEEMKEKADVVSMRAVDRSGDMLEVARRMLVPRGT